MHTCLSLAKAINAIKQKHNETTSGISWIELDDYVKFMLQNHDDEMTVAILETAVTTTGAGRSRPLTWKYISEVPYDEGKCFVYVFLYLLDHY